VNSINLRLEPALPTNCRVRSRAPDSELGRELPNRFRRVMHRGELGRDSSSDSVRPRKTQHTFGMRRSHDRGPDQARAVSGKSATQHARYVEKRGAPANQAPVVWAVTNDVTFSTQDRVLQGNRVETPTRLRSANHIRTLHHRTS
jgi:hypothetical protein